MKVILKCGLAISLVALVVAVAYGIYWETTTPDPVVTFDQIMDDRPKSLYFSTQNFEDGVVVYKHQQDNRSVLVVTRLPLPELEAGQLSSQDVIAVVVDDEEFAKVKVGSVISVFGSVTCQDTERGRMYYLIGQSVNQTDELSLDSSDFAMIAAAAIDAADDSLLGALFFLWLLL